MKISKIKLYIGAYALVVYLTFISLRSIGMIQSGSSSHIAFIFISCFIGVLLGHFLSKAKGIKTESDHTKDEV